MYLVCVIDSDKKIINCNKKFISILDPLQKGYNKNFPKFFIHTEDRSEVSSIIESALENENDLFEFPIGRRRTLFGNIIFFIL